MAEIRKYTAQQLLDTDRGGMPRPQLDNSFGRALQGLGSMLSDVAAARASMQQKREDFRAEDGYRKFNLDMENRLQLQAEQMPPDGEGFHDSFMRDVYSPERDKFLGSLPPRLREKYDVLLAQGDPATGSESGSATTAWSIKAATAERDRLYSWYNDTISSSKEQRAALIAMNPEQYDAILQAGYDEIDALGLPTKQREAHRRSWENMAQVAHLNRLIETSPETVLKELGADPRYLTPTTQFGLLKQSLLRQETGGEADPDGAISPAGAIGRMQIMPGTAKEIARELRDEAFDQNWGEEDIRAYLSNPTTNERYGDYYLRKQIKQFGATGGLEAALIAYNGGPERAKAWIASGFNDDVLPAETRKYYREVLQRVPGLGRSEGAAVTGDQPKFNPANVKIDFGGADSRVSEDLQNRVRTAFASVGLDRVRVTSGYRDPTRNAAAGGARRSQHIHGNAMDIDVTGMSHAERNTLIRSLSAAGITGIGVGSNIIHADLGGRRAWGYKTSAGGGPVPKWAQEAISEHLAGTAKSGGRVGMGGRYASLPYAQRQQFIANADKQVTGLVTSANKASAVERVALQNMVQNELASLRETGQTTGAVDDATVSTVLGEDAYVKYVNDRNTAQRVFSARDGIGQMTLGEMDQRLQDYEPVAGSPTFAADQQVKAAVAKEIDRITRMRAKKPSEAAMQFDDVREAWAKIADRPDASPEEVQEYVRLNLARQEEFGLKPGSLEPVPREWSMEIGRALSRIPEQAGRNAHDVNASILVQYDALYKVFGDFTDEVILNALATYKGIGKNTAEILTGYMQGISAGGDPLGRVRQRLSQAEDMDQVESLTDDGFWGSVRTFFRGGTDEVGAGPAQPRSVNDEMVLRAVRAISEAGDDMTPEVEQDLRGRYGDAVMDRALQQSRGGL